MSRTNIINKIAKLDLMIENSSEQEKQTALFLKQSLMSKYDIKEEEIIKYKPKQAELKLNELFESLNLFE